VAGAPGGTGDDTMAIATVNPATGEIVKTYDEMSEDDVERCLAAAAALASYRDQLRREGRVADVAWQ
jgi:acyl-CoA reductase-like NAD-dependent aldehyde dehydrogenase